jgi:hypothetical protein
MPTVSVDKADLFERLGKHYSQFRLLCRTGDERLIVRVFSHGRV